ncbi:MAG: MFS transporter [Candidatus Odinarchaeota archaeon]
MAGEEKISNLNPANSRKRRRKETLYNEIRALPKKVYRTITEMEPLVRKYIVLRVLYTTIYLTAGFSTIYYLQFVDLLTWGTLLSVYTFIPFVLEYFSGTVTDRVGEKAVMVFGTSVFAMGMFIASVINNAESALLAIVVGAIGLTFQTGCISVWFNNQYTEKYKDVQEKRDDINVVYGQATVATSISYTAFPLIGGLLIDFISMRGVFALTGVSWLVFTLVCLFWLNSYKTADKPAETPEEIIKQGNVRIKKRSLKNPLNVLRTLLKSLTKRIKSYSQQLYDGVWYYRRSGVFRISLFYSVFYLGLAGFFNIVLQPALQEIGLSIEEITLVISGSIIFMMIGASVNNRLKKYTERYVGTGSTTLLVLIAFFTVFPFVIYYVGISSNSITWIPFNLRKMFSLLVFLLASIIFYTLWGAMGPIFGQAIYARTVNKLRARNTSLNLTMNNLFLFIGYPVVGLIVGTAGFANFILFEIAFIIIVATSFFLWSRTELPPLLDFDHHGKEISSMYRNNQVYVKHEEVFNGVVEWSENPDLPSLFITASVPEDDHLAGHLASFLVNQVNDGVIKRRTPVFIDLERYCSSDNLESVITKFLIQECNLSSSPHNISYFKQMHEQGELILIFNTAYQGKRHDETIEFVREKGRMKVLVVSTFEDQFSTESLIGSMERSSAKESYGCV